MGFYLSKSLIFFSADESRLSKKAERRQRQQRVDVERRVDSIGVDRDVANRVVDVGDVATFEKMIGAA